MTDTITLKREDADRLLLILEHRWDNHFLIDALKAALAAPEPLVRYCPDCGSIGPVPATARDCCPDGQHARMVPENFAKSCRKTFMRAIGQAQPVQEPARPCKVGGSCVAGKNSACACSELAPPVQPVQSPPPDGVK